MENKYIIIGISILAMLLLNNLGMIPFEKFAISDSDFVYQGEVPVTINNITIGNITSWINYDYENRTFNYPSGKIYYELKGTEGVSLFAEDLISVTPNAAGTYNINKYKITLTGESSAKLEKWQTIYTKETVTQNVSVPNNTISYVQNISYVNVTKNVTVEKTVYVEKELTFWNRYWLPIAEGFLLGGVIIFLLNFRRRR